MATEDKKITDLTTASTPTGAELFELVQGGVNKKATLNDIVNIVQPDFVQAIVDTTGDTITLDLDNSLDGTFSGSATFSAPRTVVLTNYTRAAKWDFTFEVTAEGVPIDFGANARSTHPDFSGGVMSPADVGLWKAHAVRRYGTDIWLIDFNGVYSVGDAPPEPPDPGDTWVIGSGIWNDTAVWKDTGIWRDTP